MAIDPTIPLSVRPFQPPDPIETMAKITGLRSARQRERILEQQIEEADRDRVVDRQLRQLFAGPTPPDPQTILRVVGPARGMKIVQGLSALQSDPRGDFAATQKLLRDVLLGMDALPEATRAETYPLVRQTLLQRRLITAEDAPETYDPAWWARTRQYGQAPAQPPDNYTLGDQRFSGATNQPVATAAAKPVSTPTNLDAAILEAERRGDQAAVDRYMGLKERVAKAGRAPAQPSYGWATDPATGHTRRMTDEEMRRIGAGPPGAVTRADIPTGYRDAIDRAIMSVPAIRRGSVIQTANRLWEDGSEEELKGLIRQAAVESENADSKNQIRGRQVTLAALADTKVMLGELKKAGVPTGWLTGNVENLARKLGTSTNPKYAVLGNRLMDTLITYRRQATGVQFSQRESEDYARMFPNYKNELPVNLALIEGMERAVRSNDRVFWESKLGKAGAELVGATAPSETATRPSVPGGLPTYQDYLRSRGGGR